MKRNFLLFLLVIISSSCKVEDTLTGEPRLKESYYIEEFKTVFLQDCLTQSFGREITSQMLDEDTSTSSEFRLGLNAYKKIRYLADSIATDIKKDSTDWTNKICPNCPAETIPVLKGDGKIGKRTFKFCLEYYESEELDLIVRQHIGLR